MVSIVENHIEDIITTEQVMELIKLLGNKYVNLKVNIYLYRNRWRDFKYDLKERSLNDAIQSLFSRDYGHFLPVAKRVSVFKKNGKINEIVNTIFHEMRHAFQEKYRATRFYCDADNYITSTKNGYAEQWIERDARRFAEIKIKKYKEEINKILGI